MLWSRALCPTSMLIFSIIHRLGQMVMTHQDRKYFRTGKQYTCLTSFYSSITDLFTIVLLFCFQHIFVVYFYSLLKVNEAIFHKVPTIAKLLPLFNEYKIDSAVDEITTPTKEKEINEFINALLDTEVMKIAMEFLRTKGL